MAGQPVRRGDRVRPSVGVAGELLALGAVLWGTFLIPTGLASTLYILVAEFLATYLIHCPAHYFVGRVLGIRFVKMGVGRTTLARALPPRLSKFARLFPIFTLKTDKLSLANAGNDRAAAMFASGTIASALSAFAVAAWFTSGSSLLPVVAYWALAFGYLVFDLVFSPKSGDLMRARVARASTQKPVQP